MLVFWGTVIAMLGFALFIVLWPLFRRSAARNIDRNDAMVGIYRNRLQEMEAEVTNDVLSGANAEAARTELAHALLQETDTGKSERMETGWLAARYWWTAGVVAVLVPVIAVMLYLRLGTPEFAGGALLAHAGGAGGDKAHTASIEAMVARLAERLEQQPDDPEGWMMLVNSYMTLGRHDEALKAIERLYQMTGDQPPVLVRYADVLATARGGDLSGKPSELIQRALALDPENVIGLWLAGMAAAQAGSPATAIDYWQRLLPHLEADQSSQQEVQQLITQAREQMGSAGENQLSTAPAAAVAPDIAHGTLAIKVSLSPDISRDLSPEYALFIVAKAVAGPPMPVAVIRRTAADLPLEINMDDDNSMMPTRKLSSFAQLEVSARISPSGNALPQPGDLVSTATVAKPGQGEPVTLVIDKKM